MIDLFAGSSDGLIRETWYNWGNGAWGGWITIYGATFTADPQAVATTDGHDQIFADANGVVEQTGSARPPAPPATGCLRRACRAVFTRSGTRPWCRGWPAGD